jgi:hypothetical protein
VLIVNLIITSFNLFCLKIDADCWDVLYLTEVPWDSVEAFFFSLRLKMEVVMNDKGKVVAELGDEK